MKPEVEAVLDLITPYLLEQIIYYNTEEFDCAWEPQHVKAVEDICEYIAQTYTHRFNQSLFNSAEKLKRQIEQTSH